MPLSQGCDSSCVPLLHGRRATTSVTLPNRRRGSSRHVEMTSKRSECDVSCLLHIMSWVRIPCTTVCLSGNVRRTDVHHCIVEMRTRGCCIVMHDPRFCFAPAPTNTPKLLAPGDATERASGQRCTSAMPSQQWMHAPATDRPPHGLTGLNVLPVPTWRFGLAHPLLAPADGGDLNAPPVRTSAPCAESIESSPSGRISVDRGTVAALSTDNTGGWLVRLSRICRTGGHSTNTNSEPLYCGGRSQLAQNMFQSAHSHPGA